ncbi:MAG TPA: hypothetical protein VFG30_35990 [Polyangiales bacterium]|nr:hypothetical protein [Polyangiales bacterium]
MKARRCRVSHGPWICLALALSLVACTGEAYLGAIAPDGGRPISQPIGASDASGGRGGSPPSAAGAGDGASNAASGGGAQPPPSPDAATSNDAKAPDADAAVQSTGDQTLCLAQPSFEIAIPAAVLAGVAYTQAPWSACFTLQDVTYSAPLFVNEETLVDTTGAGTNMANVLSPANDGSTYLYLDTNFGGNGQTTSQTLCDSLLAGRTYAFAVDLLTRAEDRGMPLPPGKLEVYASPDGCSLNEGLLWSSPSLTPTWTRHCVRFTPSRDSKNLLLRLPKDPAGRSTIGVDNIRFEPGCGLPPS